MPVQINQLPLATTLTGAELVPVVQTGSTVQTTVNAIFSTSSGIITASAPILNLAQTWNNAAVVFTGIKLNITNTASNSSSLLMDLQTGGVSTFNVTALGEVSITSTDAGDLSILNMDMSASGLNSSSAVAITLPNTGSRKGFQIKNAGNAFAWASFEYLGGSPGFTLGTGSARDVGIARNAAGVIEINNATAGTFRDLSCRNITLNTGTINKLTLTAPATGSTITITDGKTLAVSNSLTLAGTDSTTMTFPGTSDTVVTLAAMQTLTNKTLTTPIIASISNTGTLTLPTSTDTLVGRATTDTLTNKTLTAPVIGAATGTSVSVTGTLTAFSGTAIPANGTTGSGILVSSTANFGIFFGSNTPSLSAAKGSLYLRSDGTSTSTRAYINTDGGTTWTAITTAA